MASSDLTHAKPKLLAKGDPADHIYEVVSGTVCTCKMLREGRRQVAGFYFAGDIVGLESAKKHSVTVEAITNAKVRIFKKRALTAFVLLSPHIGATQSAHS